MAFSTLHYSEDGATIACSSPVDDTIARTAEPNDVNCTACILEMTGEYPSAEDYGSGYAHGKDKAHFELRTWTGAHAGDCGCEPCQTVRAVIGALSKQPGLNWMMENHASRI